MEYRKVCSECNEPSDEFNTDKYGKVICDECSAGSHCFCSGCGEFVPTSEINVVDSVLDVDGMEIEETNIYCSECNESIAEDEPSWCENDNQICDGCADKPSQDPRGEDKPEEGKIYALTGGPNVKCIANGDSWKDSVVQNDEPKSYAQKVNEEIECVKFEQKQYHGDLDILKEGFVDSDEAEWDGLGITYESVRQCSCSDCGKQVSELELRLFGKHSKVKEDLCKDCHSKSTANLSMKEMAKLVMGYLPCHTDGDLLWTLENQFKRRSDLAYMLMVVSKNEYEVRDDIWS